MNKKFEQIKDHVKRNKERYIAGVLLVGTNVIWYFATKNGGSSSEIDVDGDFNSIEVNHIAAQYNFAPKRLSYIVTDGEKYWETQKEAAKALGVRDTDISKHINHGQDLKNGIKLERVGVRS